MSSQCRRRGPGVAGLLLDSADRTRTQEVASLVGVVDRANAGRRPSAAPGTRADCSSCRRAVRNVHLRATRLAPRRRALHVGRGRPDPRQDPCTLSLSHWWTGARSGAAHFSIPSPVPARTPARRIQMCHQTGGFLNGSVRSSPPLSVHRTMTLAASSFDASFTTFSELTNDERTRTFLALEIGAGHGEVTELSLRFCSS